LDFIQAILAIDIKEKSHTQPTSWKRFYAGNVSNKNQKEEPHTTHSLDKILWRQFQQ
jgi:hypothetical protein